MEILGPGVLNPGPGDVAALSSESCILKMLGFVIEIASDKIGAPLAESVVNLKDDGGENLVPGVKIPKRDGIEGIPQKPRRRDEVCVRIGGWIYVLVMLVNVNRII